ncbi:unnamed protein product, partial [Schistosoma margrebowiei]
VIDIKKRELIGFLEAFCTTNTVHRFEILNEDELFAVRWFINKEVNGKQFTAEVICLIHPNGRIVFYYDE